jgi:predicted permease
VGRLRAWFSRLGELFDKKRRERELDAEMESHLRLHIEDNLRAGMSLEQARREAIMKLGGVEQTKEDFRQRRGLPLLETLLQDLRYAVRTLRKNPGFALVAVLTLALGIGANTAIFSLVNAILIRPLPYPAPEELVGLGQSRMQQGAGYIQTGVSLPNVKDIAEENTVFQQVAYYRFHSYNLIEENAPERVLSFQVSSGFLPMFGIEPRLGRFFSPDETAPGKDGVVIISFGLWQRRFAGAMDAIGKSIVLDQRRYAIVGVMPRDFQFTWDAPVEVLVPLAFMNSELGESARSSRNLETLARMKPGVTHDQAQSEMRTIAERLAQQYPEANKGWNITVEALHAAYHRHLVEPLLVLLGAVSFVLLIACANIANLLLSRMAGRRREVAIRLAVGASRLRMIRQFLTESLLLAAFGGACGLLLAYWGTILLRTEALHNIHSPGLREMRLDWRVLAYALAVAFLTSIVFGLGPALHASKMNLNEMLKESSLNITSETGRRRLRSGLVIIETALAIVLMTGAGLLIRTFVRIAGVDLGFNPNNALTMWISLPDYKYGSGVQQSAFFRDTLDRIRTIPGVDAAASFNSVDEVFFTPATQARPAPGQEPTATEQAISPEYFRAMGGKFLAGRDFSAADAAGSPPVAIINQTLAHRYWHDRNPVGDHLVLLAKIYAAQNKVADQLLEVVGVVADIKTSEDVWQDHPEFYVPYLQLPLPGMGLVIRTQSDPMSVVSAARAAVLSVDSAQPVHDVQTLSEIVSLNHDFLRFPMALVWIFAALALLLAAIGIFGVMSYSVSQRIHEMAIRIALGAGRRDVLRLTVGEGLGVTLIGVGVGVCLSLGVSRLIASYLYGVSAYDPVTFIGVALLLVGVALVACYLPARRAARVDPLIALRYE